jgi:hypothetical protein
VHPVPAFEQLPTGYIPGKIQQLMLAYSSYAVIFLTKLA